MTRQLYWEERTLKKKDNKIKVINRFRGIKKSYQYILRLPQMTKVKRNKENE